MNIWQVQSLRLTVFRQSPADTVTPVLEQMIGEKPTKVDYQPRDNVIREEIPIILGNLIHIANPIRTDFHLQPSEEQLKETSSFPVIGTYSEINKQFIELITASIIDASAPEINRIALGTTVLQPGENKESCYKILSEYLPHVEIDIENSTDFLYQINRPINSLLESGLVINRLTKWSAARFAGFGIMIGDRSEIVPDAKERFACRLEIDVNTSQYHTEILSKNNLPDIIHELNELCVRIMAEGDR